MQRVRYSGHLYARHGWPYTILHREVHIVDDLKAKMLIELIILKPEGVVVHLPKEVAVVGSCNNILLPLTVTTRDIHRTNRTVVTTKHTVIPPRSHGTVPIASKGLPKDRDLLFEPDCNHADAAVFAHIVDHTISERNNSDRSIIIPRKMKMGHIVEYEADGYYLTNAGDMDVAAKGTIGTTPQAHMRELLAMTAISEPTEHKLLSGITIFGNDTKTVQQIANVVCDYLQLWTDTGNVVDVPEDEWMDIPLVENWESKYKPGQARVYPLGQQDGDLVNKAFDRLHHQGRLEWTRTATPFSYPCFVVWRTMPDKSRKGRVVVHIRALSKISMPDAYPVPSQAVEHYSQF